MSNDLEIYTQVDFGMARVQLKEVMDKQDMTVNMLATKTQTRYTVVKRYYDGFAVGRLDLVLLAKFCYILQCDIPDVITYIKPKK